MTKQNNDNIRTDIIETLFSAKRVLIAGHMNPDGDSLGSQLGLAGALDRRNIPVEIVNDGIVPNNYLFLPGIDRVKSVDDIDKRAREFDLAVLMECSSRERIGNVTGLIQNGCRIVNIDHHSDNNGFGHFNLLDFSAAAAGEIVYELLVSGGVEITPEIATNLYTAILTDTGRFRFSSTTPKSLRVAAELMEKGADTSRITDMVYFNQSIGSLRLTGEVLLGLEYHQDNRVCFMTITDEMLKKYDAGKADTEGLVNYTLRAEGVKVGVLFSERESNVTKVSLRSVNEVSIIDVAVRHNGGGHKNACGCTLQSGIAESRDIILNDIRELLHGSI